MGENEQDRPAGVFASLRRLADLALATVYDRIELLSVELQEEKERLIWIFVLAAGMVFLGNMAVMMLTLTIIYFAGEHARAPLLIALTLLYLAATAGAFFFLRKQLRNAPRPFNDSLSELEKDRQWLTERK